MARTAQDLEAAMRVLGGPDPPDSVAYTWRLTRPRHTRLRDFRIGYLLEDPTLPVSSEIKPALESAVRAFENAGARLQPGWPPGFSISEVFSNWYIMVMAGTIHKQARLGLPIAPEKDSGAYGIPGAVSRIDSGRTAGETRQTELLIQASGLHLSAAFAVGPRRGGVRN